MRILLADIFGTDTVALAPQIMSALADASQMRDSHEIETCVFSIFSDSVEAILHEITARRPDVVCFSCYVWNYGLVRQIASRLDCAVVVGGPHVTGIEQQILVDNPAIDIVATGEGEATFLALLEYFKGLRPIEEVPGITTATVRTPPAEPTDLSTIPPLFHRIFERYPDITWVSLETSRGCPMRCGYCTWSSSSRMRYFPLEHVLSQLDIILGNPRIQMIFICDSSLLFNKERGLAILDYIIESGTDKKVHYEFSPEQLDSDLIKRMLQLPHNELSFGIQTTNPAALAEIGRPFRKERFEANYMRFTRLMPEVAVTVDLIYGLPRDDISGYLSSLNYVMGLPGISRILTNPLFVLPGSRFFRNRARYGLVLADDDSFILEQSDTFSREDMLEARRVSFYVTLLYLNAALRGALLAMASEAGARPVDQMIDFFATMPFGLADTEYPYILPSIQEDFRYRNWIFDTVLADYADIIDAFREYSEHRYDSHLNDFESAFTEQYWKYHAYAAGAAAHG